MKHRHITLQVLAALADRPVVFVQGPRLSGKTTLVQNLRDHGHAAEYRTLGDAAVLGRAQRPGWVRGQPKFQSARVPTGAAEAAALPYKIMHGLWGKRMRVTFGRMRARGLRRGDDSCFWG